jgi:MFS family permease
MASKVEQREANAALRPLWMQVYIPNMIIATGQGAMLPLLALAAKGTGANAALAGVIVAVNGFGTMLFDIPSGWIVARFGEAASGWIATTIIVLGMIGALLSPHSTLLLGVSVFLAACGWAIWSLVRLTHLSRVAAPAIRGRALSVFGGVSRAGQVLGPFILVGITGKKGAHDSFLVYLIGAVVGFMWLVAARDRKDLGGRQGRLERIKPIHVVKDNLREFATAGTGTFGISVLRASRQALIPLWGSHIGLSTSQIALIYGVSSIIDLMLFYPAGIVSDRWGRKAVAVPCITILSIGHCVLPLSHSWSTLMLAALLLGFGNGLGSGIVMTLGADRAPAVGRASFLAVWRLVSDAGTTAGPLIGAGVIAVASLSLAAPVVGFLGFGTAAVVAKWLREPEDLVPIINEGSAGG